MKCAFWTPSALAECPSPSSCRRPPFPPCPCPHLRWFEHDGRGRPRCGVDGGELAKERVNLADHEHVAKLPGQLRPAWVTLRAVPGAIAGSPRALVFPGTGGGLSGGLRLAGGAEETVAGACRVQSTGRAEDAHGALEHHVHVVPGGLL